MAVFYCVCLVSHNVNVLQRCLHMALDWSAFSLVDGQGNIVMAPGTYRVLVSNDGVTNTRLEQSIELSGYERVIEAFPL